MTRLVSDVRVLRFIGILVSISLAVHLVLDEVMAEKGRDIIIWNGKVILKGGKKKGSIIISNGDGHGDHGGHFHGMGQGKYKYKKKYMNYGGFW